MPSIGPSKDGRGGDAIPPQSGDEGRRFPVPPRNFCEQTLTARRSPIAASHVGLGAGLVNENEAFDAQLALSRMPGATLFGDVFTILLGGSL